ncbi:TetR/AcrR family transcriptional regulator [Arthrobacter sp. H35-D1]|uniref:TetR/AcrR family transcriptional regulator n=1 Tax=Arthrobacter sp. H35-D1 TaxID=3046202 RepID=UPI0024B8C0CE|nr:TetR/AcrR family transcriptional regulator [Arthrobacter sp. H35-D1]MDJ0311823.1 TetR/AcrR family transcriptional regulator [Arthrobacter sp. H35-D1]
MARNDDRRRALADAGILVLAAEGARGLSHRAVDRRASVPQGTTSNYFRSRSALIRALVARIEERLMPDPDAHRELGGQLPDRKLFEAYMRDIVDRLLASPEVTIALFELRLEGTRRHEVADVISAWRRAGFASAVEFNVAAGLPGGAEEIALFHYAMDGLVFDALTTPMDADRDPYSSIHTLVERLLPD